LLGFQQGLHDFDFISAEFGMKYFFKKKEKQLVRSPK
jgi:hypothetical protein